MALTARKCVEYYLNRYPSLHANRFTVLSHIMATNGNGVVLDKDGYLCGLRFDTIEASGPSQAYDVDIDPLAVRLYSWSDDPKYQPFRKYVGCKNAGWLDEVEYFVQTVKRAKFRVEKPGDAEALEKAMKDGFIPDNPVYTNRQLRDWKQNIHLVEEAYGLA